MKSAPFSFSIPLLIMLFLSLVLGALLGSVLAGSGLDPFLGGFLACFLIQPVMSVMRAFLGGLFASAAGAGDQAAPYAWPATIRYLIAAAVSAAVAFVGINTLGTEFNALTGAVMATIATSIIATIMVLKVSMAR